MSYIIKPPLVQMMQDVRRSLHRLPELAHKEYNTAERICRELSRLGIDFQKDVAGTGIRAEVGRANGPCIALRADMDALPVTEETGLSFSSENVGIMHACGHDGHVAMLLGAADLLRQNISCGRVVFLFQPAEEAGNGASAMISSGCLENVRMIFSGHIDTHYPVGTFVLDKGLICSYTDPFTITIQGQGGHAAKPHEALDTVVIGSGLVMNLQTLVSRHINPAHAAVVTVGHFSAGTVHNVIAGKAVLEGTIRSGAPATREQILIGLRRLIEGTAKMSGSKIELTLHDGLPAVINDELSCKTARQAALSVVDEEQLVSQEFPSLGGEDFAFYQQHIPGTMIRFGAAAKKTAGPAHSSTFDFDEHVLPYGANWLAAVAEKGIEYLQQTGGENGRSRF